MKRHRSEPREPQQARAIKRVEQILDAARALVLTKGFAGLKMGEIAATAGVSPSSIYQYFPNKRAIILQLARQHLDLGQRAVDALLEPPPEDLDAFGLRIDAAFEAYYQALRRDPLARDLQHAFAADTELREMADEDSEAIESRLFAATEHLFRADRLDQVRISMRLLFQFAEAGMDTAIALDEDAGREVMDVLMTNLDACWEATILPHAAP